jgi:type III pantothenate kinase
MTVNFVDGEGTFQGGVIAPGLRMALRALHEHTAGLPELEFEAPGAEAWIGKDTREAMLQGVYHGARGLVRQVVERFAEVYEGYPAVVACGGDARVLFEGDDFVDRVVPDLVLRGIALAYRHAVMADGADDERGG